MACHHKQMVDDLGQRQISCMSLHQNDVSEVSQGGLQGMTRRSLLE